MLSSESLWSLGGSLLLQRQKDRQSARQRLWRWGGPIFLGERYSRISGENPVIRDVHTWMKLPHRVFSFPPVHSFSVFCFCSILMICSLIWLRRREAIENVVVCVFIVDSIVRCLSQKRGKRGCSLDNQSSANLISCCHRIFLLTITAPPLPSAPLPLLCQSWFFLLHWIFILSCALHLFQIWCYETKGRYWLQTLSYDWGLGYADAHTPIINILACLFRFSE